MSDIIGSNQNDPKNIPASSAGSSGGPSDPPNPLNDLLRPGADAPKSDLPSIPVPADVGVSPIEPQPAPMPSLSGDNLIVPGEPSGSSSDVPPKDFGKKISSGNKKGLLIGLVAIFFIVSTGLVFVFVNQQGSLNDIRNRAADSLYPQGQRCTGVTDTSCPSGQKCAATPYGYYCGVVTSDYKTLTDGSICATSPSETFSCNNRCKSNNYYSETTGGNQVWKCGTKPGTRCTGPNDTSCGKDNKCVSTPYGYYCGPVSTDYKTLPDGSVCATSPSETFSCVNTCISDTYHVETVNGQSVWKCGPTGASTVTTTPTPPAACATDVKCTPGQGCSVGRMFGPKCWVSHYRCPLGTDMSNQASCDTRNGELISTSSNAQFGNCGIEQIDIYCEPCGITKHGPTTFTSKTSTSNNCGGGGSYSYSQSTYQVNTPTPTVISQCNNIKIYKNGNVVTPSSLQPGDAVVIAVAGGNASKARVRVNGGSFTETTTRNGAGEFTLNYVIPTGPTHFRIESEIFGVDNAWH